MDLFCQIPFARLSVKISPCKRAGFSSPHHEITLYETICHQKRKGQHGHAHDLGGNQGQIP